MSLLALGPLNYNDPLYKWLIQEVFPQIGLRQEAPKISVYHLNASNQVFLYEVINDLQRLRVVCKFHSLPGLPEAVKCKLLETEFSNIQKFRALGFDSGPYRAVRPLGYNHEINHVLALEYMWGKRLDKLIKGAARHGDETPLFCGLSELAHFLYNLHTRGEQNFKVNFAPELHYFNKTLSRLRPLISHRTFNRLRKEAYRWRGYPFMWASSSCIVHGDCTPSNIIVAEDPRVTIFDLERCRVSDPVFDTGRLAAELKHAFMMYTGSAKSSESFITHFYREYASHSGYPTFFDDVTKRNPFYQAVTELRIAKNWWVSPDHRTWLVKEALNCLANVPSTDL